MHLNLIVFPLLLGALQRPYKADGCADSMHVRSSEAVGVSDMGTVPVLFSWLSGVVHVSPCR